MLNNANLLFCPLDRLFNELTFSTDKHKQNIDLPTFRIKLMNVVFFVLLSLEKIQLYKSNGIEDKAKNKKNLRVVKSSHSWSQYSTNYNLLTKIFILRNSKYCCKYQLCKQLAIVNLKNIFVPIVLRIYIYKYIIISEVLFSIYIVLFSIMLFNILSNERNFVTTVQINI